MSEVTLNGLSKRYPNAHEDVVHNVSVEIQHGELFVLLGPSGCGKSTTLRMIAGLESISSGELSIDGQVVNNVPARDRDIAMVFQSYALYPHMSVRDNLAFGLRRRKFSLDEVQRRVTQAAQTLELGPYLDRKPHALSGGQRQRVALGRAIVRDPKVFLFDEPLSNLDAALRVSTRAELTSLHRRLNATMIYVTHDQVEAMTMGSRICIMRNGCVEQIGAPLEVYNKPVNIFVAGFLGSPPMNLVPAQLGQEGGEARLIFANQMLDAQSLVARVKDAASVKDVLVGIRPEDVRIVSRGGITAEVVASEALGAETLVTLRLPGVAMALRARLDRDVIPLAGDSVSVSFDLARGRLFDAATGKAFIHLDD
ncbi:MAG: hypothetical protein RL682_1634 [Pseudomonadota bacterium]|jgi:multiple sugar transport system ATP-binding protein